MKKNLLLGLLFFVLCSLNAYSFSDNDLKRAISLFDNGKYKEAKIILEQIIDDNENDARAHFYLGKTLLKLEEFDDASDCFEEAIELDKNNADYYFWLGQALGADAMNSNVISQAFLAPKIKEAFKKAVEIDPKHLGGNIGLANFHLNAPGIVGGDLDKVYKTAKVLIKLDEEKGRTVLLNYFLKKEQYDSLNAQVELFEKKFGKSKALAGFYNNYGYILINQKKYNEAIEVFKKQVEILPDAANSYDSLGDGYRASGKYELAKEQYKKALLIDPNFEASIDNLEELDN